MSIIWQLVDRFHEMLDKHADTRTTNWLLMSSPFPTLFICLSYVYIVKVIGPKLMENRKPFQLKNVLIGYNLFQVIFSTWLFYECLMGGWWGQYSFKCQPVDYSDSPTATRIGMSGWLTGDYSLRCQPVDYSDRPQVLRMVHASWWYYFSKFTEFMDTIFFVLRKKTNHVSTLHVIHHGCMPMSVWFGVKFTPGFCISLHREKCTVNSPMCIVNMTVVLSRVVNFMLFHINDLPVLMNYMIVLCKMALCGGHSSFFGLLNTFVHIVMYTYYLLAALGPKVQPYLWWKKYLTAFQMIQFIAIMVHAFQLLFIDCNYPKAFVWWIGLHAVMFLFLFNEFYKQNYRQKREAAETKKRLAAASNGGLLVANGTTNKQNNTTTGSGISNGNGIVSNGAGTGNGSRRRDAADYYVKGESLAATELNMRKPYTMTE